MRVPEVDEVYDDDTVARLDAWARREAERVSGSSLPVRRHAAGAVFVASLGLGLQTVLEPEKRTPVVEEVDVDGLDAGGRVRLRWSHEPRRTVALVG